MADNELDVIKKSKVILQDVCKDGVTCDPYLKL